MNIMENKRVAAVALASIVVFGGICYYGYGRYSELKASQAKIAENNNKLADYAEQKIPPLAKNRNAITQAAKEAKALRDALYNDLLQYASFCIAGQGAQSPAADGGQQPAPVAGKGYLPATKSLDYQANLKNLIANIAAYAEQKGCTLGDPAQPGDAGSPARFGNYNGHVNSPPNEEDVPYVNFMAYAADAAMRHIIDAGAPSVSKLYFRELPASRKDKYLRLGMEIAFTAKRSDAVNPQDPTSMSVLPQVLNKLTHDKRFFFIPTGVAVTTRGSLPDASRAVFDTAAGNDEISENGEETSGADEESAANAPIAVQRTGSPDDVVNVYITLQVLYFPSDKF